MTEGAHETVQKIFRNFAFRSFLCSALTSERALLNISTLSMLFSLPKNPPSLCVSFPNGSYSFCILDELVCNPLLSSLPLCYVDKKTFYSLFRLHILQHLSDQKWASLSAEDGAAYMNAVCACLTRSKRYFLLPKRWEKCLLGEGERTLIISITVRIVFCFLKIVQSHISECMTLVWSLNKLFLHIMNRKWETFCIKYQAFIYLFSICRVPWYWIFSSNGFIYFFLSRLLSLFALHCEMWA